MSCHEAENAWRHGRASEVMWNVALFMSSKRTRIHAVVWNGLGTFDLAVSALADENAAPRK